jgi:hypothetical protein
MIEIISENQNAKYAILNVSENHETNHQTRKITFPVINVLRNTNINLNSQIKQLTYNMWSIVHLQKLIVAKKLKKSSAFYGTRRLINIGFEVLIEVNIKTITF